MKEITPAFKDDSDRLASIGVIILSACLSFIPGLVVALFFKDKVSESTYEISKAFFNFELLLFLVSLIAWVPIIGWLVSVILIPILILFNLVIVIMALCAVAGGKAVKVPVYFSFI